MKHAVFNLPNFISFLRVLLAPLLLTAAMMGEPQWFLWMYAGSLVTDFLDGFLARLLDQQTKLGSQLDTVGDVLTGVAIIFGGVVLWTDLIRRERWWFLAIIVMLGASGMVTLCKYRHLPSYHTWCAKLSTAVLGIGAWLLFARMTPWVFRAGVVVLVLSALEEMAITLILPAWRPNVPHVFHALRLRKESQSSHPCPPEPDGLRP